MILIPTPQDAASYASSPVATNPALAAVLASLIATLERSQGRSTWVDQEVVPGALFEEVRTQLARKHWTITSGYNEEERYSYYTLAPCTCCCH